MVYFLDFGILLVLLVGWQLCEHHEVDNELSTSARLQTYSYLPGKS